MPPLWVLFIILRWVWTLLPQTGYIHPDEFFQSVEIVAGDVLQLSTHRTWEFNNTQPIRSIILPYLTTLPAFLTLSYIVDMLPLTTYLMLILPRLCMCLWSTVVDAIVYKTAQVLKFDVYSVMMLYTTSYITLVYHTRTLSNTSESFLFACLLYTVLKGVEESQNRKMQRKRTKFTKTDRETRHLIEVEPNVLNVFCLALIVVAGFFNRPTFMLYAFTPCMYWLFEGLLPLKNWIFDWKPFFTRLLVISCFSFQITLLFVLGDTVYYAGHDPYEILDLNSIDVFGSPKITPLNFIEYNTQTSNLEEHTLHPRFLHILVNAQLLFGILPVFAVINLARRNNFATERTKTNNFFLLCSYFVPIILISIFPHQEPRFLIPLLLPLTLLYSTKIFGLESNKVYKAIWLIFNILLAAFYGIFHQGGLTGSIGALQEKFKESKDNTEYHAMFFRTYMPPRHLFINYDTPYSNVRIHDLKGGNVDKVSKIAREIQKNFTLENHSKSGRRLRMFLVSPTSIDNEVCMASKREVGVSLTLKDLHFPHLSTEDFPLFQRLLSDKFKCTECDVDPSIDMESQWYKKMYCLLSISVYEVSVDSLPNDIHL